MMKINQRDLSLEEQKHHAYAAFAALNAVLQQAAKFDRTYQHQGKGRYILQANPDLQRFDRNNGLLYDVATGHSHAVNIWFGADSDVRLRIDHFEDCETGLGVRVKEASKRELFATLLAYIKELNSQKSVEDTRLLCA
jgi:hypothetical protein